MIYVMETRADTIAKCLLRTMEMRTLTCITGNTLRNKIRYKYIRNIRDIQML